MNAATKQAKICECHCHELDRMLPLAQGCMFCFDTHVPRKMQVPEVVGEDTSLDRICWDEARAQLGEGATHSEIAQLAQQYKMLTLDPPDPKPHGMDLVKAILAWAACWVAIIWAIRMVVR